MVRSSRRAGLAAILCALLIRLWSLGLPALLVDLLTEPETAAFLIYGETGRDVRPVLSVITYGNLDFPFESPPPRMPPLPRYDRVPEITCDCPYRPDLEALLRKPLTWELGGRKPRVLIYHTHTTESYDPAGEPYDQTAAYRTADPAYNMLSIGDRVASLLEEGGVPVIHDRTFHDYPAYNGSYGRARKTLEARLEAAPELCLLLDLHRDAWESGSRQLRTLAKVRGQDSAQLMIVAGSNAAGLSHRGWKENLSLALKLQAQLELQCPGITRPLSFRSQRFNQDLSPGALLIEVGAAGNSRQEALLAAEQLARAILVLAHGTE